MPSAIEIVGLIPAGGHATRISPLPCSKELFPIGWQQDVAGSMKPKVVSHYLLDKYKNAGIRKAYFILRKGKWDIPEYYGDGSSVDMELAYLMMNLPYGHPFTLDQAFPFTRDNLVAFGYPDILFAPDDAFHQLIGKLRATGASVVLGIFPIRQDQRWDILSFGEDQKIKTVALRELTASDRRLGWSIAVWTPEFSRFMHELLRDAVKRNQFIAPDGKEYVMNHIFQAAIDNGLHVEYIVFDSGFVHDIGTPEELFSAQMEQLTIVKAVDKEK
jgi:glucose-1-phosphate thymidylyltransferase